MPSSFAQAKTRLEDIVRQGVSLGRRDSHGVTRQQTLSVGIKQMRKAGADEETLARVGKELQPIRPSRGTEHLLLAFKELNDSRLFGAMGHPLLISHGELKAYCDLMGITFTPWEIEALRAMDSAYVIASTSNDRETE